jgi:hypothetical protein
MAVTLNRRAYEHAINDGRFVFDERDVWMGAVAWAYGQGPFPIPAHQTGRADFRHPAFRLASPQGTRRQTNRTWLRHGLRDSLNQQVEKSNAKGARCVLGGEIPKGPGAYYPPTVLTIMTKGMPAYEEELFGPVASVIRADSENAAIATANDSAFGLGGGVIIGDIARGERIAAEIESGNVFVNDNVRSDPRLPFGGVKQSGYGRELSHYGIKEFVNIKTVVVG